MYAKTRFTLNGVQILSNAVEHYKVHIKTVNSFFKINLVCTPVLNLVQLLDHITCTKCSTRVLNVVLEY